MAAAGCPRGGGRSSLQVRPARDCRYEVRQCRTRPTIQRWCPSRRRRGRPRAMRRSKRRSGASTVRRHRPRDAAKSPAVMDGRPQLALGDDCLSGRGDRPSHGFHRDARRRFARIPAPPQSPRYARRRRERVVQDDAAPEAPPVQPDRSSVAHCSELQPRRPRSRQEARRSPTSRPINLASGRARDDGYAAAPPPPPLPPPPPPPPPAPAIAAKERGARLRTMRSS